MSAYMVSDNHINVLLNFAKAKRTYFFVGERRVESLDEIGSILKTANAESLHVRYGDEELAEPFRFRVDHRAPTDPIVILKACGCFDYQACEVDNYEKTVAASIINMIRASAIHALPGFDDAAGWSL